MRWVEFSLCVKPELVEPIVELFKTCSRRSPVVEQQGGYNPDDGEGPDQTLPVKVYAYVKNNKLVSRKKAVLESGLLLLSLITPFPELECRVVDSDEWQEQWKQFFIPMHIGSRFVVAPPWYDGEEQPDKLVVILDPGLAFGTGHHPTTRMCLEHLEVILQPGMDVLDLGVGSGILSVGAALLGAGRIIGLDTEIQAVKSAKRAIKDNGVTNTARIFKGTLPHPEVLGMDLIVANISAKVLIEQSRNMQECLVPGGVLLASGVLEERAEEVTESMQREGLIFKRSNSRDDWVLMEFKKPLS